MIHIIRHSSQVNCYGLTVYCISYKKDITASVLRNTSFTHKRFLFSYIISNLSNLSSFTVLMTKMYND